MQSQLFSIARDLPWQFADLKLLNVCGFNGNLPLGTPQTLGYYREPTVTDYPINLGKGIKNFIPAVQHCGGGLRCLRYLELLPKPRQAMDQLDFCTNRGTMIKMMCQIKTELCAIKFKGCIYLKSFWIDDLELSPQYTYLFQLRQCLIVDKPGDMPNTDRSLNLNLQNYGTFAAKLGKFRLLYTSEITGLENREPLGDLNDPKVLQQCHCTTIRAIPRNASDWRTNYRMKRWLLHSHLMGADQMKVAFSQFNGLVTTPIVTEDCAKLLKEQSWSLSECMQLLHLYLSKISEVMADVDCPYTVFAFCTKDNTVYYGQHEGKTRRSFLTEQYIDFVLGL